MSLDYIAGYYGVPARVGAPVEFEGRPGVVTGYSGPSVTVRLDGEKDVRPYHPRWHMIWLAENGPATDVPAVGMLPPPASCMFAGELAELVEPQWSGV